jgi:hypothetical protein
MPRKLPLEGSNLDYLIQSGGPRALKTDNLTGVASRRASVPCRSDIRVRSGLEKCVQKRWHPWVTAHKSGASVLHALLQARGV